MRKLLLLWLIVITNFINANQQVTITSEDLLQYGSYKIESKFLFSHFDSTQFKSPDYDDSSWDSAYTNLTQDNKPSAWNGIGWFRTYIKIDSSLIEEDWGLNIENTGKFEIYLNGIKILESNKRKLMPHKIKFEKTDSNLLAIRFQNYDWKKFHDVHLWAGLSIRIDNYNEALLSYIRIKESRLIGELSFIIPSLLLGLIHLFIFIFDRRKVDNLYYLLFLLSFIAFIFSIFSVYKSETYNEIILLRRISPLLLNLLLLFGAFTIFAILKYKTKYSKYYFLIAVILGLLGVMFPNKIFVWFISYGFVSVVSAHAGSALFAPRTDIGGEVKIIRVGFTILSLSGIYQMLLSFGLLWPIFGVGSIFLYGVLFYLITMSLALAKEFVQTSKNLEKKLEEIKELSTKTLTQELEAKELEVEKKILESDNKRKSKELKEARDLQLSMLPQIIPQKENLEIAAYMRTATEVGGDYYDFQETYDGRLLVAVGDATGHGLKAGIMVASVKSLFSALSSRLLITDFFNRCTEIVKDMKMGNLFMSFTLMQIRDNSVTFSAAGMPPIYVYRAENKTVESFIVKGMPLGAFKDFPYEIENFTIEKNDVILLMSDGLPELFNKNKEMLGYSRVIEAFSELGENSPSEIITQFKVKMESWLEGHLPEDDITLVLIKVK